MRVERGRASAIRVDTVHPTVAGSEVGVLDQRRLDAAPQAAQAGQLGLDEDDLLAAVGAGLAAHAPACRHVTIRYADRPATARGRTL